MDYVFCVVVFHGGPPMPQCVKGYFQQSFEACGLSGAVPCKNTDFRLFNVQSQTHTVFAGQSVKHA